MKNTPIFITPTSPHLGLCIVIAHRGITEIASQQQMSSMNKYVYKHLKLIDNDYIRHGVGGKIIVCILSDGMSSKPCDISISWSTYCRNLRLIVGGISYIHNKKKKTTNSAFFTYVQMQCNATHNSYIEMLSLWV